MAQILTLEQVNDLWKLSKDEFTNLQKLLDRLEDVDHWKRTPGEVVRFLRARAGNLDQAEAMFRNMVQWRLDNNVDTILEEYQPPKELVEYYPGAILDPSRCLDRDGDPIYIGRLGVTDGTQILQRYGRDEMIRHAIWIRELVSRGSWIAHYEAAKGPIRRITLIEDLHGLSWRHQSRQLLSVYGDIMRIDQDNYPETAKKLLIIRAPTIFRVIWSIAKHFFDPGVVDKMEFVGPSAYQQVLETYIDLSVLPNEIVPGSHGKAAQEMPRNFQGGPLPRS